ncbi:serine acetyltransferase [Desulfobulbus sp. F3]|nr:serine acetyltransferase [Desulfobulbus sp. F3]
MKLNTWDALKADTYREYGISGWSYAFKGAITRRFFRVIVTMRLCQAATASKGLFAVFRIPSRKLHQLAACWAGIDFAWQTNIGAGLAITHGWGIVVNPNVKIGNNVTLFHGVTIGGRDRISKDGTRITEYPIIENEVWIGPHAIIVGGVIIGRGSRIAGGAFVVESIPPYSVVVGNPASIIRKNCVPDVMNRAPILE